MQVIANERLIKRETRLGGVLLGVTFLLLGLGFVLTSSMGSWFPVGQELALAIAYGIVLVGMALYYLGQSRIKRYGPRYRQDGALRQLLKGLDDRYVLYTFLGRKLPDYVLAGPTGLTAFITRDHNGQVLCRDDRWTRSGGRVPKILSVLYGTPIGNPSWDAQQAEARLRELLSKRLDDASNVPVQAVIVFTNPNVRLRVERSAYLVTTAKELRNVVRRLKGSLPPARLEALRQTLQAA